MEAGKTDTAEERYYTISEAARLLRVSDQSVRRWVKAGELRAYKPKKEYRIAESDLEEFLKERRVPLVQAPLLNFEEERRQAIYEPWLDFVNRYADRWEARIAAGDFDLSSFYEFARVSEDILGTLLPLGLQEKREQPADYPYSFGPIAGEALARIFDLFNPILAAAAEKYPAEILGDELEPLRQKRDEGLRELRRGA